MYETSKNLLSLLHFSSLYLLHLQTTYIHKTFLYPKDERVLPADLHSIKFIFSYPLNTLSAATTHFLFLLNHSAL
jgi:hypothetical protein